jgi:hypothetical protein
VDRADFRSLGSRLIPCSHVGIAHAVDLAWRVWWWDAKTPSKAGSEYPGTDNWLLVDDENAAKVLREVEQWQRVVPLALDLLNALLSEESVDKRVILWQRIVDMQNALLTAWGVHPLAPVWRQAFFYRTITLDGRWLLTEPDIPSFDVVWFAQTLPVTDALGDWLVERLTNDPVTRGMPELFQYITDHAPAQVPQSHGLRVINGGLDA